MTAQNVAPTISVVVPTFNRGELIERSIRSVLDQTFSDFELIVVDDGSTDDTLEQLRQIEDPRLRVLSHASNQGACAARNTGIEAARGRFIAFQDSDDVWAPDKLEKQMAVMPADAADPVIVYCGFVRIGPHGDVYGPGADIKLREGYILAQLLQGNFVSTQTMLVPRQCLDVVNGFNRSLGRLQDWDLAIRLSDRYRFKLVDEPLVTVYTTKDSISSNVKAYVDALETILADHMSLYAPLPKIEARQQMHLGNCLCAMGRMKNGRRHLRLAMRLDRGLSFLWGVWAVSLFGQGVYRTVFKRRVEKLGII